MILRYALFTLTLTTVPMFMLLREMPITRLFVDSLTNRIFKLNVELVNNIFNSGVYSFFMTTNEPKEDHDVLRENALVMFTENSLKSYSGKDGRPLYLALLGEVFDVTKGSNHYGPGQSYHIFTGRDGSRAFISGDFTEKGLTDDVMDLSSQDLRSLNSWLKFYFKEYTHKGRLEGRYYDKNGVATSYHHELMLKIERAEKEEMEENLGMAKFPPCNVEWTPEDGSRVWCSQRSGGIEREWIGVPRKLYVPGADSSRCACINTNQHSIDKSISASLMEYENCHPLSTSCYVNI